MCNMRTRCHRQRVFCAAEGFKLEVIGQFLRRRRNSFPLGGSWHKIGASEPIL